MISSFETLVTIHTYNKQILKPTLTRSANDSMYVVLICHLPGW